jgi:hypothetical protein
VTGVWTDVEPIAPNLDMPIGFCINSSSNNGTIAIRVASGYKITELHDVAISSPVDRASLYYRGGLWRDTTTALLTSDTASMLTNYLRSGVAASTYLKLTGGELSSNLGVIGNISFGSKSAYSGQYTRYLQSSETSPYRDLFIGSLGTIGTWAGRMHFQTSYNTEAPTTSMTINEFGNINMNGTLDINGTLGVTGATTLSGALTVNNATVLNEGSGDFDTRIESDGNANMVFVDASTDRVGIGTGTPSKTLDVNGEVKIATVTATPTALLGKDGSNVVGEVTDINQSGVMKVGSTTQNTSSVGIINVAHGLSYTPTKVIATIAQQSSYVIVCHGITSTNFNFTIYDSTDGTALNNVSVGFFWIAFK